MSSLNVDPRSIEAMAQHLYRLAQRYASQALLGGHMSRFFAGNGDIEEIREYQSGDDPRLIDWKASARYQRLYSRHQRSQSNSSIALFVDITPSMDFGSHSKTKREVALEIAAICALAAIRYADAAHLILCDGQRLIPLTPIKSPQHLKPILEIALATIGHNGIIEVDELLAYSSHQRHKSNLSLILSDGLSLMLSEGHRQCSHGKSSMHMWCLLDPCEWQLPSVGLLTLRSLKTGEFLTVDSDAIATQSLLQSYARARLQILQKGLQGKGIALSCLKTNQPTLTLMLHALQKKLCLTPSS